MFNWLTRFLLHLLVNVRLSKDKTHLRMFRGGPWLSRIEVLNTAEAYLRIAETMRDTP